LPEGQISFVESSFFDSTKIKILRVLSAFVVHAFSLTARSAQDAKIAKMIFFYRIGTDDSISHSALRARKWNSRRIKII
jgi:hypothetical protein